MVTDKIHAVPTNLITGFLGVGKTSAILHLLKSKPANERWAVLVNEFGEIGIDGSLFKGAHNEQQGIFIREVPGGCMCCAAGLPMQVALNQLLAHARPDRLLIEPTGLGHPKEVLQTLSTKQYQQVLDVQKILTLVDARKLSDERYTTHETFNEQIAIANIVVGNKQDLYQDDDGAKLKQYVSERGAKHAEVIFTQHGEISPACLTGHARLQTATDQHPPIQTPASLAEATIPACGYIKAVNEAEGFKSIGWRFSSEYVFHREKLLIFLNTLHVERMKAVCITEDGVFAYNLTTDGLAETTLSVCSESRIEMIADAVSDEWEEQLMACVDAKA